MVAAVAFDPAPLAVLVVYLASAYRRGILQTLVLEETLENHLNGLPHSQPADLPLYFLPLFFALFPLFLDLSYLFFLLLGSELAFLLQVLLSFLIFFLIGCSPFGPAFEPVHPSLGKFAPDRALVLRLPVAEKSHRHRHQSGDSLLAAYCQRKHLSLGSNDAVQGLGKGAQVSELRLHQPHYVLLRVNPQSFAGRVGKHFGYFEGAVSYGCYFDAGSQPVFRDGKDLFSERVVESGEDSGSDLPE